MDCLKKAKLLEFNKPQTRILNLSNLSLKKIDIAAILESGKDKNDNFIESISFSYTNVIGDNGATIIMSRTYCFLTPFSIVLGDTCVGGLRLVIGSYNWYVEL